MSIQGSPRVDRDTAERLVAGQGAGPVAVVLRAAAAPAHADELAGESAAVAAFRKAAGASVPHRSVFRRSVAKALTIKAVLVVAVAGSTGVVLAASEGALPVPWSNSPVGVPDTTTTTPAPNTPADRAGDDMQSPATPDPSVAGLCEAYASGGGGDLDNPAFRALVEAAGGQGEVTGYCEGAETTAPEVPTTSGKPEEPGEAAGESRPSETPPARTPSQPGRPSERPGVTEPPTEPPTGDKPAKPTRTARTTGTEPTSDPTNEAAVTKTPDSSALGAASAVPPSGAEPPSKGS